MNNNNNNNNNILTNIVLNKKSYDLGYNIKSVLDNEEERKRVLGWIDENVQQTIDEKLIDYNFIDMKKYFYPRHATIEEINIIKSRLNNLFEDSQNRKINNSNIILYFPAGIYNIPEELSVFNDFTNVIIMAHGATFKITSETTCTNLLKFQNSSNITILGGTFDGSAKTHFGLAFDNVQNIYLNRTKIINIGSLSMDKARGIICQGDCSYSILDNVIVENITAGKSSGDYIFATGIVFNNANEKYSQHVEINNPKINNIGYSNLNKNEYWVEARKEDNYYYVKNQTNDNALLADTTIKDKTAEQLQALIDGDGIMIIASTNPDNKSYITIRNPYITNCSKRALKIVGRGVKVLGGYIDVATWSSSIEMQNCSDSCIKDVKITNSTSSAIGISGDRGKILIDNCKIKGGYDENYEDTVEIGDCNGIVILKQADEDIEGKEELIIQNCEIDNVYYPIATSCNEGVQVETKMLKIKDCTFGYFYAKNAIKLEAIRFKELNNLEISNILFKTGSSSSEIFSKNDNYYNKQAEQENFKRLFDIEVIPTDSLIFNNPQVKADFLFLENNITKYININGLIYNRKTIYQQPWEKEEIQFIEGKNINLETGVYFDFSNYYEEGSTDITNESNSGARFGIIQAFPGDKFLLNLNPITDYYKGAFLNQDCEVIEVIENDNNNNINNTIIKEAPNGACWLIVNDQVDNNNDNKENYKIIKSISQINPEDSNDFTYPTTKAVKDYTYSKSEINNNVYFKDEIDSKIQPLELDFDDFFTFLDGEGEGENSYWKNDNNVITNQTYPTSSSLTSLPTANVLILKREQIEDIYLLEEIYLYLSYKKETNNNIDYSLYTFNYYNGNYYIDGKIRFYQGNNSICYEIKGDVQ